MQSIQSGDSSTLPQPVHCLCNHMGIGGISRTPALNRKDVGVLELVPCKEQYAMVLLSGCNTKILGCAVVLPIRVLWGIPKDLLSEGT